MLRKYFNFFGPDHLEADMREELAARDGYRGGHTRVADYDIGRGPRPM